MSEMRLIRLTIWMLLGTLAPLGCNSGSSSDVDGGADTSSDGDVDTDVDSDSDTDGDGDTDTDGDSDGDTDTDTDGDSDTDTDTDGDTDTDSDGDTDSDTDGDSDSDTSGDGGAETDGGDEELTFTVVTYNTGTTEGMNHNVSGDIYGDDQGTYSDLYYGDGCAWLPAVAAVTDFFGSLQPDVVVFQEIFHSGNCPDVPAEAKVGFICQDWQDGDPTVAQLLLGNGYQVACHLGKDDKCLAVKKAFGTIRQCSDDDFCLEGLDGAPVQDCGGGSRIGRATIDLVGGGEITVVNVHGTSGALPEDADCRAKQVRQVFLNLDGEPGANGARNVVLGDFNIDPGRVPSLLDASSKAWNNNVGPGKKFHWVSPIGSGATPTYTGLLNIDHVVSDVFDGDCYAPGVSPGHPNVYPPAYFDHKPLVCEIGEL